MATYLDGNVRCYKDGCPSRADGVNDDRPACSRHEDRASYERREATFNWGAWSR